MSTILPYKTAVVHGPKFEQVVIADVNDDHTCINFNIKKVFWNNVCGKMTCCICFDNFRQPALITGMSLNLTQWLTNHLSGSNFSNCKDYIIC